jgi:hypothetical protein
MQIRDEIAKAKKRKETDKSTAAMLRNSAEELCSEASGARATPTNSINKSPIQPFKIINVHRHFFLQHFCLVTFLYGIGTTPILE